MDCVFCRIISKEIPAEVVYEDDAVLAILDVHPRAWGHAMVLPKRHYPTILEVPSGELGAIFTAVQKVTAAEQKALKPDGFTIGVNHGEVSGQAVPHLHIHILPRFQGDGGGSIHSVVNQTPKADLEATRKMIIKELK
jgi:histidine triad (HIT) family protein